MQRHTRLYAGAAEAKQEVAQQITLYAVLLPMM
jgi:hypothetical protein